MATLEQSLKLHDQFSKVLEKVDQTVQNTLGTFEKFKDAVDTTINFDGSAALEKNLMETQNQIKQTSDDIQNLSKVVEDLASKSSNQPIIDAQPTINETQIIERRFDALMQTIVSDQVKEALIDAQPTVNEFNALEQHGDKVKQSLDTLYYDLVDQSGRAQEKVDLLTKSLRLQSTQVNRLTDQMKETQMYSVNTDDILKAEMAVNNAEQAWARKNEQLLKAQQQLANVSVELQRVESAQAQFGESRGMDRFNGKVQESAVRTQVLYDSLTKFPNATNGLSGMLMPVNTLNSEFSRMKISIDSATESQSLLGQGFQKTMELFKKAVTVVQAPIGQIKNQFVEVRQSIENSQFAQTKFGQAVQTSYGLIKQFFSGLKRAGNQLLSITKNASVETAKLPFAWMRLIPLIRNGAQQMRNKRREVDETVKSTNRLGNMAKLVQFSFWVTALNKVKNLLNNISSFVDGITQTLSTMNVMIDITGSDTTTGQLTDQIMASAMDTRSAWQDTANIVSDIGIKAGKVFNNSTDEMVAFTNVLQKSYKIAGATEQEMNSSIDQLIRGLQKGQIETQELNSIMDKAPIAVQAIADYLQVPVEQLRDMSKEGYVSAETIKNAMFASADSIQERFNEIPMTWADRWNQVKNVALYAFMPLVEAWNEFINSATADFLFESLALGFAYVALVAEWAFGYITLALDWVAQNADKVGNAMVILGIIAGSVAAYFIATWLIANWPLLLIASLIWLLVEVLDYFGITTDQVIGFVVGAFYFLGSAIYNVILAVIGFFYAMFQFIYNQFVGFYNNVISIAEFFANIFTNPVHNVQMLFYNLVSNVLDFIGAIVDGAGSAGEALGDAFIWGVNAAIRSVNWLWDMIRKVPIIGDLFGSGSLSLVGQQAGNTSTGDKVRSLADGLDPGTEPEGYKSFDEYKLDMTPVDGLSKAISKMKNPVEEFHKGYESGVNMFNAGKDFMSDFDRTMDMNLDGINNTIDNLGKKAQGITPPGAGGVPEAGSKAKKGASDKIGKGKEVGDVGKIKDDVSITDEDLKYLKDIAEANFIIRIQQLSPSATINYQSTGDSKADEKKLLAAMEKLIEEQSATTVL